MKVTKDKITLNQYEAQIFTDMVLGIPVSKSPVIKEMSEATIRRRRAQIKKFTKKDYDFQQIKKQALGLVPLTMESIAYHLMNYNVEVTLKVAQSLGILAKDNEGLKDLLATVAGAGNSNPVTVNNINIQSPDELDKFDSNLASALTRRSENSRF